VRLQVRRKGGGNEPAGENTLSYGKGNEKHELGTGFCVHKGLVSTVKKVEFINDRISNIIPRGRWYQIIVPNVHAPKEVKIYSVKGSLYEELEHVFDKFPKNHMKIC
jgi:hypothetical protein